MAVVVTKLVIGVLFLNSFDLAFRATLLAKLVIIGISSLTLFVSAL